MEKRISRIQLQLFMSRVNSRVRNCCKDSKFKYLQNQGIRAWPGCENNPKYGLKIAINPLPLQTLLKVDL
jgi:hypothetical protein